MARHQRLQATIAEAARRFFADCERHSKRRQARSQQSPRCHAERLEPRQLLTIAPFVESINRTSPAGPTTNASSVTYTVTFNEPVTGVNATDFKAVTTGAVIVAQPLSVSPSGPASFVVTASGIHGSGTVGLDFVDNNSIRDASGNALLPPNPSPGFQPAHTFAVGNGLAALAVGDINGDGKTDIVTASQNGTVSVFLGNGDDTFSAGQTYSTGGAEFAALADINGDHKSDIVVLNSFNQSVAVLLGNGDGTFQAPLTVSTGFNPLSFAVADMNGDGKPDLVVLCNGSLDIIPGNGDGTFETPAIYNTYGFPASMSILDVNGDGKPDVITAGNQPAVMINNGDATLQSPLPLHIGSGAILSTADLNGDGKPDIVVDDSNAGTFSVYLGDGNGNFRYTEGINANFVNAIATDVNADAVPDLVYNDRTSNAIAVALGNGNGTFASPQSVASAPGGGLLGAADFDRDGKIDLIATTFQPNTLSILSSSIRDNFIGQTYSVQQDYPHVISITRAGLTGSPLNSSNADFTVTFDEAVTGVDAADFVVNTSGSATASAPVSVHQMNGAVYTVTVSGIRGNGELSVDLIDNGTIHDANGNSLASLSSTALFHPGTVSGPFQQIPYNYGLPVTPDIILQADVNGDGNQDLIAEGGGYLSVLLSNGDGTFQAPPPITLGTSPFAITPADLNNDGRIDLVLSTSNAISILLGNGDGTFAPGPQLATTSVLPFAVPADVNGDGRSDLIVWNASIPEIFLGNGDGTFRPGYTLPNPSNIAMTAIADLNGDGIPDLVGVNSQGDLAVALGNGDGTFRTLTSVAVGASAVSFAVFDLNLDGKPDLIVGDTQHNTLGVMFGNGDGTFAARQIFAAGLGGAISAVGDMNGDGIVDLSVRSFSPPSASTLIGARNGSFVGQSYPVRFPPVSLLSLSRTTPLVPVTTASTLSYTATFSSPVTGVVAADFQVITSGSISISNPLIVTPVSGSVYNITISGIRGEGTIGLNFVDNGSVRDAAGNPLNRGTPGFGPQQTVSTSANQVFVADVNGDGNPDLITTYEPYGGVATTSILLGNGNGTFQAAQTVAVGAATLAVGDVNGDGIPDLVATTVPFKGPLEVLLGNGNGTFAAPQSISGISGVENVVISDLNADGKADLAVVYLSTGLPNGAVLLGNGNGTFKTPQTLAVQATSVQVADLNDDGRPDLLFNESGRFTVFLGDGSGGFAALPSFSTNGETGYLADVNLDGREDLVVTGFSGSVIMLGNGDGTFGAPQTVSQTTDQIVGVGDLNADGIPDLIAFDSQTFSLLALAGNGDGTFKSPQSCGTAALVGGVIITDLNHDAKPDLVFQYTYFTQNAGVILNQASDSFAGPAYTIQQIYPHVVSIVTGTPQPSPSVSQFNVTFSEAVSGVDPTDFQVVTGGSVTYGGISVTPVSGSAYTVNVTGVSGVGTLGLNLADNGTIRDANGNPLLPSTVSGGFQQPINLPNGFSQYFDTLADVNGDTIPDLVSLGGNGLGVMLGNGNGTFQAPMFTRYGILGQFLGIADLNGDGIPDAVTYDGRECRVLLGNGNGTFSDSQFYSINTFTSGILTPDELLVADFTGDGIADIVLADPNTNAVSLLIGNGDGTFQPQRTFAAPMAGNLRDGDFNNDGKPDIVFAGGSTIGFLLGNGNGTFQPAQTIGVGAATIEGFAVSDVNDDGNQDVAVVLGNGQMEVFQGDGDGTFAAGVTTQIGNWNAFGYTDLLTLADINGDGIPDAIVGNVFPNYTSVFLGNGDGTFQRPQTLPALISSEAVSVGDFNNDGRPDLLEYATFDYQAALLPAQTGNFMGPVAPVGTLPSADAISGSTNVDQIVLTADLDGQHVDWTMGPAAGQLAIADPNGLTINGNGSNDVITLNYANGNPLPAILHLNGTFTINGLVGTNPLPGTTLDIGRSTVFLSYQNSDPIAAIKGYLKAGYNGGAWNGTATPSTGVITSSAAAGNPNHTTAVGFADTRDFSGTDPVPNSIELKYTLIGDANLDGQVNSADLQILLFGLNRPGVWDQGDFNYDGQVNSADLQGILFTLNTNLGSQATPPAQTTVTQSTTAGTPGSKGKAINDQLTVAPVQAPPVAQANGTNSAPSGTVVASGATAKTVDNRLTVTLVQAPPVLAHKLPQKRTEKKHR